MDYELLLELATMAASLAEHLRSGDGDGFFIEERLREIVQQGVDVYEEFTDCRSTRN